MSRLKRWEDDPWRLGPIVSSPDDDDPLQAAWFERIKHPLRERRAEGFSIGELARASKEVIYHRNDQGVPAFSFVMFVLDFGTAEMAVERVFTTVDEDHDDLLHTLGVAQAYGVPVVPDTDDVAPELEALERELFTEGFTAPSENDSRVRLISTRYANVDIDSLDALDVVAQTEPLMPSEARLLFSTVRRELGVLLEARRVLDSLRSGIGELEDLLANTDTNEHRLQRCLTRHPILFGPEYVQVHPKYRLGGDFEMDFALQRSSGLIDLVEIEAASHNLFTKRGDPRAALTHAEQQVLDWLDWIDRFGGLARRDLPQMQRPIGYVVIGRSQTLTEADHHRLRQRNAVLAPSIEVMTYDGLLTRAKVLMTHFERLRDSAPSDKSTSP